MARLKLYLLGAPQLEVDGQVVKIARRKSMALLAYLALTKQPQSRDVIAALLWPESDHEQARAALRSTLSTLNRVTDVEWMDTSRTTIGLNHDVIRVDAVDFKSFIKTATTHRHDEDFLPDECQQAYSDALMLYQAEFMRGFYINDNSEFESWQAQQRDWFQREYEDSLRRLSLHYSAQKQFDLALEYAQQWLAADPLQESAHRQLMTLYAASGQRSNVRRQYQQCVELLDEAFVTPPEPETTALYERLTQNTDPTPTKSAAGRSAVGVFPPLPALIVGREQALEQIKARLGVGDHAALRHQDKPQLSIT